MTPYISKDTIRAIVMTDVHTGHSPTIRLANCDCRYIKPHAARAGDFYYHYSSQLDAFNLWEVLSVDHERGVCELRTIDSDHLEIHSSVTRPPRTAPLEEDRCNKFYRPDAEQRVRVEREGFTSAYVPMFASAARIPRRRLFLMTGAPDAIPVPNTPVRRATSWLRFFKRFFR